ncbi:MAG: carboxypeptidase regulatory-like domain-containing protein [Planctomycetales bacterium]|nr:carboxypeptidase regulatory-like domain-containing protein [bacterium]UNM09679.1 MAG: carboxypeptidase regulatory-like domain-containing protein [Planctomycetales bacterium]
MKHLTSTLIAISLLLCSCGGRGGQQDSVAVSAIVPAVTEHQAIFNTSLPDEGHFNPSRVAALATIELAGSGFNEASTNVSVNGELADYAVSAGSEYAIWRFSGTPDDALGMVNVTVESAQPGTRYWTALADYSSGRWSWLGDVADGSDFDAVPGSGNGQYSSPAGYIYVAVLAEAGSQLSIAAVGIQYLQRYSVSGFVQDKSGNPIEGALLSTNLLDVQQVLSAADGSFRLDGLPAGSWAVMATLRNWGFDPDLTMVDITDSDVNGLLLQGFPRSFGFPDDLYEPNDLAENAEPLGPEMVTDATISALDDEYDCYTFPVATAGWHYLQLNADNSILFPHLSLQTDLFSDYIGDYEVVRGTNWLGYYFPVAGEYRVEVYCEGGGGHYSLELLDGRCHSLDMQLIDTGLPGDGDDGLAEEMRNCAVTVDFGDSSCEIPSSGGYLDHRFMPPLEATITPHSERYTFDPLAIQHDFASGDLSGVDFNFSAATVVDSDEPNNDKLSAVPLTLPMAQPHAGYIGGRDLTLNDEQDFYSFDVQDGMDLTLRAYLPEMENQAGGIPFMFLFDDMDSQVFCLDYSHGQYSELRTLQPLPAGSYYLYIYWSGELTPYELEVLQFPRRKLSVYFTLDGKELDYGRVSYEIVPSGYRYATNYYSPGLDFDSDPFMDGELLHVSYKHRGLSFDPPEQWIQFDGSDILLEPAISVADDATEPNDFASDPFVVSFPADVNGNISAVTDYADYYGVQGMSAGPVMLTLTPDETDVELECWVEKTSGSAQLGSHKARGSSTFWFELPDDDDYTFAILANTGETSYNLKIETSVPVHYITGTLDHGSLTESYAGTQLVNETTGEVYRPNGGSNYELGPYPDGDYDLRWYTSNHTVSPPGAVTVTISGADTVQNFTATYVDQDNLEPNDSANTGAVLTIPFSFSASLDYDNDVLVGGKDSRDYYKFVPAQDGFFQITVVPLFGGLEVFPVSLSEENIGNIVNFGRLNPLNGSRRLGYEVKSGLTYYLYIQSTEDVRYVVSGDFLP